MRNIVIYSFLFLLIGSCSSENPKEGKSKDASVEIPEEYKKNPTTVEWENPTHDFGQIPKDTVVKVSYKFKNTGKYPLIIADCKATCGCTVPECKQPPIPPGKEGSIEVSFNSHNKANRVNKTIKVFMNTEKEVEEVKFTVFVNDGFQETIKHDSLNN